MFKQILSILVVALLVALPMTASAEDVKEVVYGNVWTVADGTEYFTCPVMGKGGTLNNAAGYSDINGVRYLHCCPPCQGPFRANPEKYLKEFALPGNISKINENGIKYFIDPVNSKEKKLKDSTKYFEYEGKRFYFTSKKNVKLFKTSPENYLE
jgi:YHS domain-containing protein